MAASQCAQQEAGVTTRLNPYLGEGVDTVLSRKGEIKEIVGNPKQIGLFFTARWCPPCKGYTPMLAEYYRAVNKDENKKGIEIIFISSDKDQEQFDHCYRAMPWLALEYSNRDAQNALWEKYGITGIPTLVLLNPDGSLKSENGKAIVMNHIQGKN